MNNLEQTRTQSRVCVCFYVRMRVCVAGGMLNTHTVCSTDHPGKGSVLAGAHTRSFLLSVDSFYTQSIQEKEINTSL